MKSLITTLLLAGFMLFLIATRPAAHQQSDLVTRAAALCAAQTNTLDSFLQQYSLYFFDSSYTHRALKYEQLAYYFRGGTGFIVYFNPALYRQQLAGPFQFQRREGVRGFFGMMPDAFLFQGPLGTEPDSSLSTPSRMRPEKDFISGAAGRFRQVLHEENCAARVQQLTESELFDALRTEIFRISTIDVANSDFIIDEAALPGLRGSLNSWLAYGELVSDALPATAGHLKQQWRHLRLSASNYLARKWDFRSFNRMVFIKEHLIPLSKWLYAVQMAMQVPFTSRSPAWKPDAASIYDSDGFNVNAFSPGAAGYYTPEKMLLGQLLFFDPVLSGNGQRACASCHKPSLGFTDGRKKSLSFDFNEVPRNAPTIFNAGMQKQLFWDLRAASLEDQSDSVINNPHELNGSFPQIVARLTASHEYVRLFAQAFPGTTGKTITAEKIKQAIAVYERSLSSLNSPFDQYIRGDSSTLTQQEIDGFNLFMGKARCGVCHYAPLFNGAIPPFFDTMDDHSLGVMVKDSMTTYLLDDDPGVMKITGNTFRLRSFKVPTVRNAALTAPYMHNGVFNTLEQVINFYDTAAGNGFQKDVKAQMRGLPFFTILPTPLHLTDAEKKELLAFLECLTDTSGTKTVPVKLPRFQQPFTALNKRKPGGAY